MVFELIALLYMAVRLRKYINFTTKTMHQLNQEIVCYNERKGWRTVLITEFLIYCHDLRSLVLFYGTKLGSSIDLAS